MEIAGEGDRERLGRYGGALPKVAQLLCATLLGIGWLVVALQLQNTGYKTWVVLLGLVAAIVAMVVTRRPKEMLLFGWVFSLTYNRQYYIFEPIVGYNGTAGPYVIPADLCLLGLFTLWLYERLRHKTEEMPKPGPYWPWYLPFAAVCFLSVFAANRPDWSLYELMRIAKMGLILFYVRHNIRKHEWRVMLGALAAAVSFQAAVAIKEISTGRQGVIGLSTISDAPAFVEQFQEGRFTGMVRGQGTMAHPPYLSCYFLLVLPVLLALSVSVRQRRTAILLGLSFLLGCGGLAVTLSRGPWIIAALQVSMVLFGLVLLRVLSLRRALGMVILGAAMLAIGLIPVAEKVINRFTGDMRESVAYRKEGTLASFRAIAEQPMLGFGLNNTSLYIVKYLPQMEWAQETEEFASRTLHLRAPVALGNGLLYVAEQTGILGLIAFLIFVGGGLSAGIRALSTPSPTQRAACLGLLVGIFGALAEQIVDTPLWVDPNLYTFTLYLALLNCAGVIFPEQDSAKEVSPREAVS